ncbi:MAG: DUF2924 domain-containing protein [Alphaproteobacteria bacterium]
MNNISAYIANLENLTSEELVKIWGSYFNEKPEQTTKRYLIRRIAYRVQEIKYGGLRPDIIKLLNKRVKDESKVKTNPLKLGTTLSKIYKDVEFRVKVVEDGFEYNGFIYKSLTKVAFVITGQKTSGPLFFGVKE